MAKLAQHWGMIPEPLRQGQPADVLRFGITASDWRQNKTALKT
jgi:hypothetical protein